MALLRLTGTYVGFEEFKQAMEKLPAPPKIISDEIQVKYEALNMAAKLDTCNLHSPKSCARWEKCTTNRSSRSSNR
jgi:hypothetical protein